MILGGLVARIGQSIDFDKRWRKLLKREGLSHFHGKNVRARSGELRGWPIERRDSFVDRSASLIEKHALLGFTIMLRLDEFSTQYVGERQKGLRYDSPYGMCFRSCLTWLPSHVEMALNRTGVMLDFVFESGHKNAGDIRRIFNEIKCNPAKAEGKYLGSLSFADKKSVTGLQGADSIAYLGFRGESKNTPAIERPTDSTFTEDRRRVKSRSPIYRCQVDAGYMAALRHHAEAAIR